MIIVGEFMHLCSGRCFIIAGVYTRPRSENIFKLKQSQANTSQVILRKWKSSFRLEYSFELDSSESSSKKLRMRVRKLVWLISVAFLYSQNHSTSAQSIDKFLGRVLERNNFWKEYSTKEVPKILHDPKWGTHHFVQLKDVRLHYVSNGDRSKPLMLLLHSIPEFWFSFRYQLQYFAKSYWVVAVDMRGCGESERPRDPADYTMEKKVGDVLGMLEAFGRKDCILVAHDWGGFTAWNVAAKYPHLVNKLILLNAPHPNALELELINNTIFRPFWLWMRAAFAIPNLGETMGVLTRRLFVNWWTFRQSEEEREAYIWMFSKRDAWTTMLNYDRSGLQSVFGNGSTKVADAHFSDVGIVESPTLMIWGLLDAVFLKRMAEASRPYAKNMKIAYLHGSHFIQIDKPNEVNTLMEKFLNEEN